jgi:hypothetical protein
MKFPLSFFFTCSSSYLSTCGFHIFQNDISFFSHRHIIYFLQHRFSVKVNATSQDVVIKEKKLSLLHLHDCKCSFCVLFSLTTYSVDVLTAIVKPSATVERFMCSYIAAFLFSFNAATNNNCLHKSPWRYKWREQEGRKHKMSLVKLNRDGPIRHPRYINISKQCTWDCSICLPFVWRRTESLIPIHVKDTLDFSPFNFHTVLQ